MSVQILIDHMEVGEVGQAVTLADCSRASRAIQEQVDLDRYLFGRYSLEVSSPGLDRPLTRPAHYRRFQGKAVAVRLKAEKGGRRLLRGTIAAADDEAVVLAIAGEASERIEFAEIASARLQVDAWKAAKEGRVTQHDER
jgi:ribosome maturation factor RimP